MSSQAIPMEAVRAELRTPADFVRWGTSRFNEAGLCFGHGADNALDEALALVLGTLHLEPGLPAELWHAVLTQPEREQVLANLLRRIEERIPAAYITHTAWFAGSPYYVDERVLVPRSPIAELVESGFSPWLDGVEVGRILDLCTGCGCIAAACAQAFPEAEVVGVDLSPEALAVAHQNIGALGLKERVVLVESDLFSQVDGTFDLIVSNPPYVSDASVAALPDEYHHEPAMGLASGADGLDCVHRILREAGGYLAPDGVLVVEVGESRPALTAAYPELPFLWLDFVRGGENIFLLNAAELADYNQ